MDVLVYAMIYAGSALMVYNIVRSLGFAKRMRALPALSQSRAALQVPSVLLILFLADALRAR